MKYHVTVKSTVYDTYHFTRLGSPTYVAHCKSPW